MARSILFVSFSLLTIASGLAEQPVSMGQTEAQSITAFVASAPKATTRVDLSYAIKIPEKERRQAIVKCEKILARDKTNDEALKLLKELQEGNGAAEAIASIRNDDAADPRVGHRISEVLRANLIPYTLAGSRGWTVNVSESHAGRARFLLAKIIVAERLDISLNRRAEDRTRSFEVRPEEIIATYIE